MVDDPRDPTVPDTLPAQRQQPGGQLSLTDYLVRQRIGVGGMGEVLLAHDPWIGRDIAIKRMRETAPTEDARERFLREARIQARLDHPAIVPVHEIAYDADGHPYFIMKKVAGVTLAERLDRPGPIKPLLRALIGVCHAIDLAHARRVVHRDLKPSNIMLGEYGEVYVLDWGVARLLADSEPMRAPTPPPTPPSGTQTGAVLGTPGYMAPEQLRGDRGLAEAADIYSLGAILFEILAGEPLHPRADPLATTIARPTDSPARRRPDRDVAPELERVCQQALAEDPAGRPTARMLAERLEAYLDGDRDLEHRRSLAAHTLDEATAALAAGKRSAGIFAAGRALALDPDSLQASELVLSLLVEPPTPLPAELETVVAEGEDQLARHRSQRAILPLLAMMMVLPIAAVADVTSWPTLIALVAVANAMAGVAYAKWRVGWNAPGWLFFGLNFVLVVLFSRVAGPLLLAPVLVCGLSIVIGTRAPPWQVVVFGVLAILVPLGLENIGLFAITTTHPPGPGIVMTSAIFDNARTPLLHVVGVTLGTVALTAIVGLYATMLTRQRQVAQRALQIQTWTLQQLLPRRR